MSKSSYLISHNHPLYILLTGTGKIMDIKELVMQSAEYPQRFLSDGELGKLSDFIKEQEGTTEYQQVRGYYDPESQTFKARQDAKGIWTIGYGSTITSGIKVKKGDTLRYDSFVFSISMVFIDSANESLTVRGRSMITFGIPSILPL